MSEFFKINQLNCEDCIKDIINELDEAVALVEVVFDTQGGSKGINILVGNKSFGDIWGMNVSPQSGKALRLNPSTVDRQWYELCVKVALTGEPAQYEYHAYSGKFYQTRMLRLRDGRILAVLADITWEKNANELIQKHQVLFEHAQDIILYVRMDGSIADANRCAVQKYGYTKAELLTKNIQDIRHPCMSEYFDAQMAQADQEGIIFESVNVCKDGSCFPAEVSAKSTDTSEGRLRIHIVRDITERKRNEERINWLANYDSMTGIPNRAYLLNSWANLIERANSAGKKLAVIFFDLDKFKSYNDRFGHAGGDAVLIHVANQAKSVLGETDIIGRIGGDEFVIIQNDVSGYNDAVTLAQRVIDAANQPLLLEGQEVSVGISLGISIYPDDSVRQKDLLHLADQAMYEAKKNGNGYFRINND
ncbi:MAG TPA: sensor domain-containing diguanylate cyclase [Bacillota bacterium]|nr:sensor domain-containing diguanylate cyclase [Bacillota bacterium]